MGTWTCDGAQTRTDTGGHVLTRVVCVWIKTRTSQPLASRSLHTGALTSREGSRRRLPDYSVQRGEKAKREELERERGLCSLDSRPLTALRAA